MKTICATFKYKGAWYEACTDENGSTLVGHSGELLVCDMEGEGCISFEDCANLHGAALQSRIEKRLKEALIREIEGAHIEDPNK